MNNSENPLPPLQNAAPSSAATTPSEWINKKFLETSPVEVVVEGGAVEIVEIVENESQVKEHGGRISTNSTFSTGGHDIQQAIYPENSFLARYMDFARTREESADSYLIAAIIPVIAASAGRRISFAWGDRWIYPNLFVMLAGKPGDRKSSAVNLAGGIAKVVLQSRQFLPDAMSAEALFDEYDEDKGGSPDKILIADDANPFLGLLQKTNYGERVGQRLLNLYDCKGLYESFKQNNENNNNSRREISATSTSMILGATFNICQFQGHEIRSGLQRRFLYYAAERHGRFIAMPPVSAHLEFLEIVERLKKIAGIKSHEFKLSPGAVELWTEFQRENRRRMENEGFANESHVSRLNGQPEHVLKLAMIFEMCIWLENFVELPQEISVETLQQAILHSELCIFTGKALENISRRAQIQEDSEVLISKIAVDFCQFAKNGWIILTRTDLTAKYIHHGGRKGAMTTDELYLRLIPDLIRRSKAKEILRSGKQPAYAFFSGET